MSADVSTRDVTMERRINAQGDTEIKVKGWFKVHRLPGIDEPPLTLMTLSPEWVRIGSDAQAEAGDARKVAASQPSE